jgi:hypothetical protein
MAGVFEGSTKKLVIPLAVLGDDQADRASAGLRTPRRR